MFGWVIPRGLSLGARGERVAARHLRRAGYRVLAKNLRSRVGEVDVLAVGPDGRTVVVVEVKTGAGGPMLPEVRVGAAKQRKLTALAVGLVRRHKLEGRPIRFDVVGVTLKAGEKPVVRHYEGAFESRL